MAYNPTPNDPIPPDGGSPPGERPVQQRNRSPDEAPTQRQPPAQQPSAAPQPAAASHSQYTHTQQQSPADATGAQAPTRAAKAQTFWRELTLLGQVAGIAGLALFIFFFLPWCFTPDTTAAATPITNQLPTSSHSGWATAVGLPILGGSVSFNLFPHLWLVLMSALALMAIAALLGLHRINQHMAALLTTITALVALLLEVLFLVQINSFQGAIDDLAGGRLNQTLYGASWGFWLSLVATIVALGVGAYMLYQEYTVEAASKPHEPRFPGNQQPTPTA